MGFWRRLNQDAIGRDAVGREVKGRTWVKGHLRWRDRPEMTTTVYVKSSIASAKAKAVALSATGSSAVLGTSGEALRLNVVKHEEPNSSSGWVYVMRCPAMDAEIYKVGFTSKHPKQRSEELSSATGVPLAFVVVESWQVNEPKLVEALAHEALTPYRLSGRKVFFKAPYEKIRSSMMAAVAGREQNSV